jgi:hypothetical protein
VDIGAADRGLEDADQHVVDADLGDRHILQPQAGRGVLLDEGFHGFRGFHGDLL